MNREINISDHDLNICCIKNKEKQEFIFQIKSKNIARECVVKYEKKEGINEELIVLDQVLIGKILKLKTIEENINIGFKNFNNILFFENDNIENLSEMESIVKKRLNSLNVLPYETIKKFRFKNAKELSPIIIINKLENDNRRGFFIYTLHCLNIRYKNKLMWNDFYISNGNNEMTIERIAHKINNIKDKLRTSVGFNVNNEKVLFLNMNGSTDEKIIENTTNILNLDEINEKDIKCVNKNIESLNIDLKKIHKNHRSLSDFILPYTIPDSTTLRVYSDATIRKNQKTMVTGAVFLNPSDRKIIAEMSSTMTTNNATTDFAEFLGIKSVLLEIKKLKEKGMLKEINNIEICCDNNMIVSAFNGRKSNLKSQALDCIKSLGSDINIKIYWIRGHDIDPYNKVADRLAKKPLKGLTNKSEDLKYDDHVIVFKPLEDCFLNANAVEKFKKRKMI